MMPLNLKVQFKGMISVVAVVTNPAGIHVAKWCG